MNRDRGIEITEAWMPMYGSGQSREQTPKQRGSNALITAAENQTMTAEYPAKVTLNQSTSSPDAYAYEDKQYAVETSRSTSQLTT